MDLLVLADKGIGMKAISQFQPRGHEGGFVKNKFFKDLQNILKFSLGRLQKNFKFVAVEIC